MKIKIITMLFALALPGFLYAADTYTSNYNLRLPDLDVDDEETPWGQKYNNNFTLIDSAVSDVAASAGTSAADIAALKISTGALKVQTDAIAVSTGVNTNNISALILSTGALKVQTDAIAVSTGVNTVDIAALKLSTGAFAQKDGDNLFTGANIFNGKTGIGASTSTDYGLAIGTPTTLSQPMTFTQSGPLFNWTSGGSSVSVQGIFAAGGGSGLQILDNAFSWNGRLDLGTLYGPKLYGKGSMTAPYLGLNNSAPTHTLDVTGSAAFSSSVTAAAFHGPLTGAASLNVLKAGDTMTGNLTMSASGALARHIYGYLDATQRYDLTTGADAGGGVGGSALTLYDGNPIARVLLSAYPTGHGHNRIFYPTAFGKLTAPTHALDVTGGGVFSSSVTAASFHGPLTGDVTGNVTGAASLNVLKAGDTMTGDLTVPYLIASSATIEAIYGSTLTLTGGLYGPWAVYSDSVTASEFYGDGSNLSGVVTSEVDPLSVPLAGGNMTGQLTTASTITVQGNAFSVGGSTLAVSGGKVGIGTASPVRFLHILGDAMRSDAGGGVYTDFIYGAMRSLGTDVYIDAGSVGKDIYFRTSKVSGFDTIALTILDNGNVGIGTTAPASKLHLSSGTVYNDGTGAGITTTGTMTPVVYAAAQIILTAPAALYGYATCSDCTNGGTAVPPILCISTSTAAGGWKAISTLSGSAGCYP